MKNFIEHGEVIEILAPAGGVVSGALVVQGAVFGVATITAAEGQPVNLKLGGVYRLPATAAQTPAQGAALYWDATGGAVTTTATSNTKVGVAFAAKAAGETTAMVRLNGSF